jgi:hypothetical protein
MRKTSKNIFCCGQQCYLFFENWPVSKKVWPPLFYRIALVRREKVVSAVLNGYLPKEVHFFKENLFCLRKKEILNEKKFAKKLNCHLQYFMVLKRKRMVY